MDKHQKEIRELFPLTLKATQKLLDSDKHIGVSLLKERFPNEEIFWGLSIGHVAGIEIGTYEETINNKGKKIISPLYLQRSIITSPREITFELRKNLTTL